ESSNLLQKLLEKIIKYNEKLEEKYLNREKLACNDTLLVLENKPSIHLNEDNKGELEVTELDPESYMKPDAYSSELDTVLVKIIKD
ncbi:44798_t:CDS:2, partial [Gigaspora margarita]